MKSHKIILFFSIMLSQIFLKAIISNYRLHFFFPSKSIPNYAQFVDHQNLIKSTTQNYRSMSEPQELQLRIKVHLSKHVDGNIAQTFPSRGPRSHIFIFCWPRL